MLFRVGTIPENPHRLTYHDPTTRHDVNAQRCVTSDYAPFLYVLKRAGSRNQLIVDDQKHVLQIATPPFVFINIGRRERIAPYPLNFLMRHIVIVLYVRALLKDYEAGRPNIEHTRIELLGRACRTYISRHKNFRFVSYDVLSGPTERFDVVRAMNLLNHTYFSEPQLRRAVANVVQSLSEGGLFITGSNDEQGTIVRGGIYKLTKRHLRRINTSGGGSPIDALIAGVSGLNL